MSPSVTLRHDMSSRTKQSRSLRDPRHPLYLGTWKRPLPAKDIDIARDDMDEPHLKRKHAILAKYPHIKDLYGPVASTKYVAALLVTLQLSLAYYFGHVNPSTPLLVLCAYLIGGTATSNFGVIIHEATHYLCSPSPLVNRMIGLLANVCIPFPISMSFRRYHLEHHAFQGVFGKDPDLPLRWEYEWVRSGKIGKALFLFFYPMMYVIRGAAMGKSPSKWEIINWVFTISTNIAVYATCGWRGLGYLFASLWLGYGIHPGAAHFIQEHFTFVDGQETYSYYGWMNYVFMNIGTLV